MQIDLEPDRYASQDRKGFWRRKSNPKRSGVLFGFCAVFLGAVWWQAGGVSNVVMLSAMIAFAGGILAADWLRDLY